MSSKADRMEEALRGVAGVLEAVCGGMLDALPKDKSDWAQHEAATDMLLLVKNHIREIAGTDHVWDLSCDLIMLADKAADGRLIRYGKAVSE